MAMNSRNASQLLGIAIDRTSIQEATEEALQAIDREIQPIVFACANPHSLAVAQHDNMFRAALTQANFVTMMSRLAGVPVGPRITGTDYFQAVLNALQQRGKGRVFFFGSSQRVLDLISARFASDYPSLTLCGTLSPPYGTWSEAENQQMVATINAAQPDVLWVGMTAPKQEKWVEANRQQLNARVIGSIGAVFDFYAGTYSRAPQWVCNIGLEWAYRFMLEPRRMWERNFVSAPKFIWLVLNRHIFRKTP
jgi:N-acetylglucosaminyldiphosphoundecaprenol N-acetyl-beta-D-mannosaminyltransferase